MDSMNIPIPGAAVRIIHAGHGGISAQELDAVGAFVVQPTPPEFNERERARLEGAYSLMCRTLAGEFAATGDDYFFLLQAEGRYLSHIAYSVDRRNPTIGIVNFVLTDPGWLRRGLSTYLCGVAADHFAARGGKAMYLGTSNPTARRIYIKCGFKDYHGQAMRWVTDPAADAGFDEWYFDGGGDLSMRPAEWGDGAPATCLFTNRFSWIVRDFSEGIILRPGDVLTRATSIFYSLFGRSEFPGNTLQILRTEQDRLVGCVSTLARNPEESVLEFMVHPNFAGQAAPFLGRRLETAKKFVSYAAEGDTTKLALLQALGFQKQSGEVAPSVFSYWR
jgi:GNAT superfamily N-acetyltransferase